jgi:hypothetical protein
MLLRLSGHHALDLAGALDDVHGLDVAVELLDQMIAPCTHGAQELHPEARRVLGHARSQGLRHRRLDDVGALPVRKPSGAQTQEPRHAKPACDILEAVTHPRIPQQLVLAREREGFVQHRPPHAHGVGGDDRPARVEGAHRGFEARPLLVSLLTAEEIGCGNPALLEGERGGFVRLQPHLLLDLEPSQARGALLDEEGALGRPTPAGIEGGLNQDPIGAARVADETLGAVQDPVIAIPARPSLDGRGIGPGSRLGHREAGPARSIGFQKGPEEALLLLLRPEGEHIRLGQAGPRVRHTDAAIPVGRLLGEQQRCDRGVGRRRAGLRTGPGPARAPFAAFDQPLEICMVGRDGAPQPVRF